MTHRPDTGQVRHRNRPATESRNVRTFSSGRYLADLMAELDRAAISARISEARDRRAGLTQPELAELLSVHWRTIQDWESPKNATVPWDRLGEIAEATGVTKEWLLHGDQPEVAAGNAGLEQLAWKLNEARVEILDAVREERPVAPALDPLRVELEGLRVAVEAVQRQLAVLVDRQSPPSAAEGP